MGEILVKSALVNIEDYEKWLEDKASEGLSLKNKFGVFHVFNKTKKEKVRYFLDSNDFNENAYIKEKNKMSFDSADNAIQDYEDLYKESGWELVSKIRQRKLFSSNTYIHLWRKKYTDQRPEAITDNDSFIKLYKNNISVALTILAILSFWGVYGIIKFDNNILWYLFFGVEFIIIVYYSITLIIAYKKCKYLKLEKEFKS